MRGMADSHVRRLVPSDSYTGLNTQVRHEKFREIRERFLDFRDLSGILPGSFRDRKERGSV